MDKKKIAVLGGGVAGCTAAYWLSHPSQQGAYDVTLFQTGWRLGGKGASGRNPTRHQRSEEHGLHIWFGFYQTAFQVLRDAYRHSLPNGDWTTFDDAFEAQHQGIIAQRRRHDYDYFVYNFPANDARPGGDDPPPGTGDLILRAIDWILANVYALPGVSAATLVSPLADDLRRWRDDFKALPNDPVQLPQAAIAAAVDLLRGNRRAVHAVIDLDDILPGDITAIDRLTRILDLGLTAIIGLFDGGILVPPRTFDKFDNLEFCTFLERHGARYTSLESGPIKGLYDLPFAYRKGRTDRGYANIAAGVALRAAARIFFGYKGAFVYKMNAGMGETVFTPFYEALRAQGVTFRFFHRVRDLALDTARTSVARFGVDVQAEAKGGDYYPLVELPLRSGKALRVWPNRPVAERLVEGTLLPAWGKPDFESAWCAVPRVTSHEFSVGPGQDFDAVVLAIPVGAHRELAAQLIAASPAWAAMVDKVETARTACAQLWLKPKRDALRWSAPNSQEGALVDGYSDPFNTWMDQSVILKTEQWPAAEQPGYLAYFCGPLAGDPNELPHTEPNYPRSQTAKVESLFRTFCRSEIKAMWPGIVDGSGELAWPTVHDVYFRANIDPSERYVLSVAGSTQHRLAPGASGFGNLYLAGDWTANGMNAGCVEAAAISGSLAARAISGMPERISGEHDFES